MSGTITKVLFSCDAQPVVVLNNLEAKQLYLKVPGFDALWILWLQLSKLSQGEKPLFVMWKVTHFLQTGNNSHGSLS